MPPTILLSGAEALALHEACADLETARQALLYLADHAHARGDLDRATYFSEIAHVHRIVTPRTR